MKNFLTIAFFSILCNWVAADWNQFQGPSRNATIKNAKLYQNWPDTITVEWSKKIEQGYGGASVVNGKIYLLDRFPNEKEVVYCFDFKTGEEKWRYENPITGKVGYVGSRTVPTVAGEYVVSIGSRGMIYCNNIKDGSLIWQKDTTESHGTNPPNFGVAESALILDDKVIFGAVGSNRAGVVALSIKDGSDIWLSKPLGASMSMPGLYEIDGVKQIVFVTNKGKTGFVSGVSIDKGEVLWQVEDNKISKPIPMPGQFSKNELLVTSGYNAGSFAIKVTKGEAWKAEKEWTLDVGCQLHMPIAYADHIFMIPNENTNLKGRNKDAGGLHCYSFGGELKWKTGASPNFGRGPMILINDYLLISDGDNGSLYVVKPSSDKFELVKEYSVVDPATEGKQNWAPLAYYDGYLLIRSLHSLKKIKISE